MEIKEVIFLAGGLGTRLRSAVPDLPKSMAPVAGKPFIAHLVDYFWKQGVERFIFSLGYKHEAISSFINDNYPAIAKVYSIEAEPLGTGGAVKMALKLVTGDHVLIVNGDTFFGVNIGAIANAHIDQEADCTICLCPKQDFDRYGVVELNEDNSVKSFREKQFYSHGLINGGIYALRKAAFSKGNFPERFSFEKDYLELQAVKRDHKLFGLVQDHYFIDIGVPEDYERAQKELLLYTGRD
ncbi:MAG: nucleotidyltransferase family protein [Chitinophagaceae bacterium]|nr:nucleotidyltransferase family protein [Chitinophagaceae bacterium]